jgi:hypothetical protein
MAVREENGDEILEERELYSWKAASRVYKTRGKDFYSTVIVLALLISVIIFFVEGLMPVVLVWAIVFVVWAINKTPPEEVEHIITNRGIRTGGNVYFWQEMVFFFIEDQGKEKVLRIVLERRFPGQLGIVLKKGDENNIKQFVGRNVELHRPEPTWMDRFITWFKKKVPLEE